MRKLIAIGIAAALGLMAGPASGQVIVRDGVDYDGISPGECTVFVHDDQPTELHVNCRRSTTNARVRYRFLRSSGGTFDPANVRVYWDEHGGDCSHSGVRWMMPVPRTLRVLVAPGCYAHILQVRWKQPV